MRTSNEINHRVSYWLEHFTLAELFFVLNEDARISLFDKFRIEKIAFSLRHTFFSDQSDRCVKMLIDDLSHSFSQTRPVQKLTSLSSTIVRQNKHFLVPFQSSCPTCGIGLDSYNAIQRRLRLYCQNGSVVTGEWPVVKTNASNCLEVRYYVNDSFN